jgi:hypothetical protein
LITAQSLDSWFSKMRLLACARLEVRMSIEVVCRKVQHRQSRDEPIDLLELKAAVSTT